ncbi:MAG: right-handed parallel beta-helix repeat-containing protein [Verrucomicrobiota bacterium]
MAPRASAENREKQILVASRAPVSWQTVHVPPPREMPPRGVQTLENGGFAYRGHYQARLPGELSGADRVVLAGKDNDENAWVSWAPDREMAWLDATGAATPAGRMELGPAERDGNVIKYRGLAGTAADMTYEFQQGKLKEDIMISALGSPPVGAEYLALNFQVAYAPELEVRTDNEPAPAMFETGHGIQFYRDGRMALQLFALNARDARGNPTFGRWRFQAAQGKGTLTILIPANWLRYAAYPVTIDPSSGSGTPPFGRLRFWRDQELCFMDHDVNYVGTYDDPNKIETHAVGPEVASYQDITCGDLNGDGYDELVVLKPSTPGQATEVVINDVHNNTQYVRSVLDAGNTALRITSGDADADGKDDLFLLYMDASGDYWVRYLHTLDNFNFEFSELVGYVGFNVMDIVAADVDGDLADEVAILYEWNNGDYNGAIDVCSVDNHFPLTTITTNSCKNFRTIARDGIGRSHGERIHSVHPRAIAAADLDQDGRDDLIVLNDYWDNLQDRLKDGAGWGLHWEPLEYYHSQNIEIFNAFKGCSDKSDNSVWRDSWKQPHLMDIVAGDLYLCGTNRVYVLSSDGEVYYSTPFDMTYGPVYTRFQQEGTFWLYPGITNLAIGDVDGDSVVAQYTNCYTHVERVLAAYEEMPPAWDGINLDQSTLSIEEGKATSECLEGKVSMTTEISIGVEAEADLEIFTVSDSIKSNITTAVEHFDSTELETSVSHDFTWPEMDEYGNLFRDDGLLVFDETQNVYEYRVLNPRKDHDDPSYFVVIGAADPVPGYLSRHTYETEENVSLGLIGNRIIGRVTTYPTNAPAQSIHTNSPGKLIESGATDILTFTKNEGGGDTITEGSGIEGEFSVGAGGIKVTAAFNRKRETSSTFSTSISTNTAFSGHAGGPRVEAAGYEFGGYLRVEETPDGKRDYFHYGFYVPLEGRGVGFTGSPTFSNYSGPPDEVPTNQNTASITIDVYDPIGLASVTYKIIQGTFEWIHSTPMDTPPTLSTHHTYSAEFPLAGLPKLEDLNIVITATNNNNNSATYTLLGCYRSGSMDEGAGYPVFRIVDSQTNPPVPVITGVSSPPNMEGDSVIFNGSSSGEGVTLTWNFGDGSAVASGTSVSHNYYKYGIYTVTLTAVSTNGTSGSTNLSLSISNEPPRNLFMSISTNTVREGQDLTVSGYFQDPGMQDSFTVTWDFGDGSTMFGRWEPYDTNNWFSALSEEHIYRVSADTNVTVKLTVNDGVASTSITTNLAVKHNHPPSVPTLASNNVPAYGDNYDLDLASATTIHATWQVSDPDGDTVFCYVYLTQDLSKPVERDANLVPNSNPTNQQADLPISSEGVYYWMIVAKDAYGGVTRSDLFTFQVDDTAPTWSDTTGICQAILENGTVTVAFGEASDPSGVKYNLYFDSKPLTFSAAERVADILLAEGEDLWPWTSSLLLNLPPGKVYYFGVRAEDRAESYPGYAYPGGSRIPNEDQNTTVRMAYATPGINVTWSLQQLSAQALDDNGNHIVISDGGGVFTAKGSLTISASDTLVIAPNETLRFDDTTGSYGLNVVGTLQSSDHGDQCSRALVVGFTEEHGSPTPGAASLIQSLQALGVNTTSRTGMVSTATLDEYDAVFVALGCYPYAHTLTTNEAAQLEGYLTNGVGGCALYMEGGRCWSQSNIASLRARFSVSGMPGNTNYFQGMAGAGPAAGLNYPAPWAGEANADDHLTKLGNATVLLTNKGPSYPIMISATNIQGYRTVASVAEFGGLANNTNGSGGRSLMQVLLLQSLTPGFAGQCGDGGPKSIVSVGGHVGDWYGITASLGGNGGSIQLANTTVADAQTGLAASGATVDLENCTIQNCSGHGVFVAVSPQVTVNLCSILNNGEEGFAGIDHPGTFQNNSVSGNGGDGVAYEQPDTGQAFVIQNNMIQQNGNNGISLGWAGANVQVLNNQVSQNGAVGIYMAVYGIGGVGPQINNNTVTLNQDGCCFVDGAQPKLRGNTIINNTRYGVYVSESAADLGTPADAGNNTIHSSGSGYDAYNATPASIPGGSAVNAVGNAWNPNPALPPIESQFYPGALNDGFNYCPFLGGLLPCNGQAGQTPVTVSAVQHGFGLDVSWTVTPPNQLTDYVLHYGYSTGVYPFAMGADTNLFAHIDEVTLGVPVFLAVSAVDTTTGGRLLPSVETNLVTTWADLAIQSIVSPSDVIAGQPFQLSFTVTNRGPATAPGVWVTNTLPLQMSVSNIVAGIGSFTTNGGRILFNAGNMAPLSSGQFTFTLIPTNTALVVMTNFVQAASGLADPVPYDNQAVIFITCHADNDRDGMPDDWEVLYGLSPTNSLDALQDLDGDGVNNLNEYLAGTKPDRATSVFRLTGLQISNHVVQVSFSTATGKQYSLERCTNLLSLVWVTAKDGLTGNGQPVTVLLSNEPPSETTFYRVRLVR